MELGYLFAKLLKKMLNPPAVRRSSIDRTAKVCSKSELSGVKVGRYSYIGNDCFMVNVSVGSFCSIADRVVIGGATHPMQYISTSPVFHKGKNILKKNFAQNPSVKTPQTTIENDVWIGMGAYVKAGVTIHNGAVIGMGSVVTHDVPAYEIWAGNPARKIRDRFPDDLKKDLENTCWWDLDDNRLEALGESVTDPELFLDKVKNNENTSADVSI